MHLEPPLRLMGSQRSQASPSEPWSEKVLTSPAAPPALVLPQPAGPRIWVWAGPCTGGWMGQRRVQVTCRARTPSSLWFSVWPLGLKSGHLPVSLSHPPPNRGPWDHSLYRKCFSYSQGHFLCLRSLLDPESGGVGVCAQVRTLNWGRLQSWRML